MKSRTARTFSKSANEFIDANAKTQTAVYLAEFAVNMAVNDVIQIIKNTLIEQCPHIEICTLKYNRGGCSCAYLDRYMNTIKRDERLCFK